MEAHTELSDSLTRPSDIQAAERWETILDAARRCVLEKGPEHVTAGEIAEAAGVSPGLLYHYFSNKDELVLAALAVQEQLLREEMGQRLAQCKSATEKLMAWLDYLLPREPQRQMWSYWLEMRIYATRNEKAMAICREAYLEWRGMREAILAEGVASGEFRVLDIRQVAETLGSLMEGLAMRSLVRGYLSDSQIKAIVGAMAGYVRRDSGQDGNQRQAGMTGSSPFLSN